MQRYGPISVKEYWRWIFHLVNWSVFCPVQARHSQPAAALVAHRPSLLLVYGLLVRFQHFFKRQFPGFCEVPGLGPFRRDWHSRIAVLSASVGGSGHDCGTSKSILYARGFLDMIISSFTSISFPNGTVVQPPQPRVSIPANESDLWSAGMSLSDEQNRRGYWGKSVPPPLSQWRIHD